MGLDESDVRNEEKRKIKFDSFRFIAWGTSWKKSDAMY